MNFFNELKNNLVGLIEVLAEEGRLPRGLDAGRVTVEPPRDPAHGDLSTNAAMVLAKPAQMKPRDVAALLMERLSGLDGVEGVEVAGPGFINMRLASSFWHARLAEILRAGTAYGDSSMGANKRVNVEYVSANPTGPMHVGHGRGAVFGDVLAALLEKAGYRVEREYYVNDAGTQIDVLARSVHLRYREALGERVAIPKGCYPGAYLIPLGRDLAARDGERWRNVPEEEWMEPLRTYAVDAMMRLIREDLEALGVTHSVFFSERSLIESGAFDTVLEELDRRGLIYRGVLEPPKGKVPEDWEPRPQTLFRSTDFGDDVDRPLRKSDGNNTYFANDIAYHADKLHRGFDELINVWGADHGGYVKRMQAAVRALSDGRVSLDVKLCQLVKLMDKGEPVKMSKRSGSFVTLREVIDQVGRGVVRFIMLTRKNDAPLDFDLTRVREQSRDNPVFYVQYAHARAHSVLRHAAETFPEADLSPRALAAHGLDRLTDPSELALIRVLAGWPRQVESAAEAHEPHRLAFYMYDVASAFHALWNKGKDDAKLRFLVADDPELSFARLALIRGMALVIASGLAVFGVEPVEEMR